MRELATALAGEPTPAMAPLLAKALAQESDPQVKALLAQAHALTQVKDADPAVRRAAAHIGMP